MIKFITTYDMIITTRNITIEKKKINSKTQRDNV